QATPAISFEDLANWCRVYLGSAPAEKIFSTGHLSVVVGVSLTDGRDVVIKVRPFAPRLAGCYEIQVRLSEAGYPCPRPLTPPIRQGDLSVSAEEYVEGGEV